MFVICSTGARNEWGAKIALQIDFELKRKKTAEKGTVGADNSPTPIKKSATPGNLFFTVYLSPIRARDRQKQE
jgi:hypothetical protein